MTSAKRRRDRLRENTFLEGGSPEDIERIDNTPIHPSTYDAISIPDWLSYLNMLFSLAGFVLLISGNRGQAILGNKPAPGLLGIRGQRYNENK
jgi:hypothetical protein